MKQMGMDVEKSGFLDTWKEISNYAHQSVRTCQRWEQNNGFPVHRYENSPKSRVFAFKEEIDLWLEEKKINSNQKKKKLRLKFLHQNWKKITITSVSCLIVCFTLIAMISWGGTQPSDFTTIGSKLIILNKAKKILWKYDTGFKSLEHERHYRNLLQPKSEYPNRTKSPLIVIDDIDNDGSNEVVFIIKTTDHKSANRIICFSKKGTQLWDYPVGGEIEFGTTSYSNDFRIKCFKVGDLNNDKNKETVIISNHGSSFPCQILILDSSGNQIGEYWNSGHMKAIEFYDFNNDNFKEILLAGINEESKKPSLAILNFKSLYGSSPQIENAYKCADVLPNKLQKYLLFPLSVVDENRNKDSTFIRIDILKTENQNTIALNNTITYLIDSHLKLIGINFSSIYRAELDKLNRKGIMSKNLKEIETELMKNGILFFDGTRWLKNSEMLKSFSDNSN